MKQAYFVTGAEGSGTRLITRAICSVGVYGDADHVQRLDNLEFENQPDQIVFRRSCPHGDHWPDLADIYERMAGAGYQVMPILVTRDDIINIDVQVRHDHAPTHRVAHDTIKYAIEQILLSFSRVDTYPTTIRFEPFIRSQTVRDAAFATLGLPPPTMEFHDSSAKYRTPYDPVVISHLP